MKNKNFTRGFILKKNFYKDTSVFLEIFTLNLGKKTFFIKNFKKSKKINSAFLNIGSEIEFDFSEKGDVGNILEITYIDGFENLDEKDLRYLSYFLGLSSKFLHENEKNSDIYLFLKKFFLVFKKYSDEDGKNLLLKIFFEVNFFTKLGYLKNLEVKFLNFLQKNEIENVLNIKIGDIEKDRVFTLFDDFLLDHGCEIFIKLIRR